MTTTTRETALEAALKLARNRLQACAIDHPTGSREMAERSEWADEATAALSTPANEPQGYVEGLEAAASKLQNVADNWDCGHNESRLCDCAPYVEQWGLAADEIRAMITPDQLTAIAAHVAAEVADAKLEMINSLKDEIARQEGAGGEGSSLWCIIDGERTIHEIHAQERMDARVRAEVVKARAEDAAKLLAAAGQEYVLEHVMETDWHRQGRHSTVRGMMVRMGLYVELEGAIDAAQIGAKP